MIQARGQGILPYRVVNVKQSPWIDHVQVKARSIAISPYH